MGSRTKCVLYYNILICQRIQRNLSIGLHNEIYVKRFYVKMYSIEVVEGFPCPKSQLYNGDPKTLIEFGFKLLF